MDARYLREIQETIGHKWDLLIIAHLSERSLRYMELLHEIRKTDSDLTEGVLNKNLKRLAANGLIRQEPVDNYHHVYTLTSRGRPIAAILDQVTAVGNEQSEPGEQERATGTPGLGEDRPNNESGIGDGQ